MADELTGTIIAAAIEVHRILGPGLLEAIYDAALRRELTLRGIALESQKEVDVVYKGCVIKGQRIDLLVEREVVVEIKSVARLPEVALAQVLSYLKATGLKRGLLLNFGEKTMIEGIKRVSLWCLATEGPGRFCATEDTESTEMGKRRMTSSSIRAADAGALEPQ